MIYAAIRAVVFFVLRLVNGLFFMLSRKQPNGRYYHMVVPYGVLAPWKADAAFLECYGRVKARTLKDRYKLYELWALAHQTQALPGDVLEVGVWRGGSGALLAKAVELSGATCSVFLCDTFRGVPKAGEHDPHYRGGEYADTEEATTRAFVEQTMGLGNVQIVAGVLPDETGEQLADKQFRLCHVDVDVYDSAKDVFEFVWPRMPAGGVLVFDDYGFLSTSGVTKFVDEQRGLPDRVVIHNLNGHGLVVKTG